MLILKCLDYQYKFTFFDYSHSHFMGVGKKNKKHYKINVLDPRCLVPGALISNTHGWGVFVFVPGALISNTHGWLVFVFVPEALTLDTHESMVSIRANCGF